MIIRQKRRRNRKSKIYQDKLKNEIEINQRNYEKLIDTTADEISSFVEKATLEKLS